MVLDVCPISNVRTGAVTALAEHPLPRLVAAGVACSVSTDDPAMFGTDLTADYEAARSSGYPRGTATWPGCAVRCATSRPGTRFSGRARRSTGLAEDAQAGGGGRPGQARSNRSRLITLPDAATKSFTNFSFASSLA